MQRRSKLVGRFAPSPTGRMHLGNIWAALLAWLAVRSQDGVMILRVEDLDPERSQKSYSEQLMKDLDWLGLDWDEGPGCGGIFAPYYQSERFGRYDVAFRRLLESGHAYPCFCSREERNAASAPHRGEQTGIISDPCLEMSALQRQIALDTRRHTWRLQNHGEEIRFSDMNYGDFMHRLDMAQDHVVLKRSDGVYAYPLAVVADDGEMEVTQVVRGSDLLISTPVQLYLMDLLGYKRPRYGHVPLLVDIHGHRLSKRQKSLDLGALIAAGWTAEGIIGFLAYQAGFANEIAPVKARELLDRFNWGIIGTQDLVLSEEALARAR